MAATCRGLDKIPANTMTKNQIINKILWFLIGVFSPKFRLVFNLMVSPMIKHFCGYLGRVLW